MQLVHYFMMVMATFRLVDIFVGEAVWGTIRHLFPSIPWTCVRCMSVWAGAVATIFFITIPWLNWPLALSWIYLAYGDWMVYRQTRTSL